MRPPERRGPRQPAGAAPRAGAACRAGCGDQQVRSTIHLVHRRRSDEVAAEPRRPQLFTGVAVPRADLVVAAGAEHEARLGHDDAVAHLRNAGPGDPARGEHGIVAKSDAPLDGRLVQVIFHDRRERRLHAGTDRSIFVDHQQFRFRPAFRVRRRRTTAPSTWGFRARPYRTGSGNQLWWRARWVLVLRRGRGPAPESR